MSRRLSSSKQILVEAAITAWRASPAAQDWPAVIDTVGVAICNGRILVWPGSDLTPYEVIDLGGRVVDDEAFENGGLNWKLISFLPAEVWAHPTKRRQPSADRASASARTASSKHCAR